MRRFSQRNPLVTLSEINITPLLDLAFVLLIIFIITTPLLTQSIELKLPRGGQPDKRLNKNDIRTVEITSTGYYKLEGKPVQLRANHSASSRPNFAATRIWWFIFARTRTAATIWWRR